LDDRREARAEGGMRFQREGAITAKDSMSFLGRFYSPPLSKVHYGRDLYSSRKVKNRLTS